MNSDSNTLTLRRIFIDTQIEHIVYMRKDCPIYKAEGFESMSRVQISVNNKFLVASLNIVSNGLLDHGEAGLSESAWHILGAVEGGRIIFSHPAPVNSMQFVRAKIYGNVLSKYHFKEILHDVVLGKYSNVEISSFITACAGDHLSLEEITALTEAMVESGQLLKWKSNMVVDKHCVGGLPGNRTTPLVVAIVAEAGLVIPKTSSRAITSPAGTADTMETLTQVDLDLEQITRVVERENGCFVWGGSVKLSPADDILIRIERALDIDSDGQMIASVLSKKSAAGSTHVIIDIPVGKTAKVRTQENAEKLKYYFKVVGSALHMNVKAIITDGSQPVGRGIGPALEALDILSVLRNESTAPQDLKNRAILLAGEIFELSNTSKPGEGQELASEILSSGRAYAKFLSICKAQGAIKEPQLAKLKVDVKAIRGGTILEINNRKLAKLAKLAGAPKAKSAGILLHCPLGKKVQENDVLYTIYAEETGELNYALDYLKVQTDIILIA
ncbi:MAG: thymidine phosphorylase family protein [bacterium]|nr:thymidine phosphorylase family protein [bacterium]